MAHLPQGLGTYVDEAVVIDADSAKEEDEDETTEDVSVTLNSSSPARCASCCLGLSIFWMELCGSSKSVCWGESYMCVAY